MLDLIMIIMLALIIFLGWRRGALRVLANIGSLFVAFLLARFLSGHLAAFFSRLLPVFDPAGGENQFLSIIALFIDTNVLANYIIRSVLFVIVFVVVTWLIRKLASFLTSLINFGIFGIVNKALGAIFAGVITLFILFFLHSMALPFMANLGAEIGLDYGFMVIDYIDRTKIVLPLVYALPHLVGF